jgi:histidinol-phosphate/aromatic aminotransferase/cobyric acid decarboxylase-like protein
VPEELARVVEAARPAWPVGAAVEAAAIAAASDEGRRFVDESRERLLADRADSSRALERLGLRVHPSETVYTLADVGARSAVGLRRALLGRHGVLIRDATSFGLPHHVRVAARPKADLERLVRALGSELEP